MQNKKAPWSVTNTVGNESVVVVTNKHTGVTKVLKRDSEVKLMLGEHCSISHSDHERERTFIVLCFAVEIVEDVTGMKHEGEYTAGAVSALATVGDIYCEVLMMRKNITIVLRRMGDETQIPIVSLDEIDKKKLLIETKEFDDAN